MKQIKTLLLIAVTLLATTTMVQSQTSPAQRARERAATRPQKLVADSLPAATNSQLSTPTPAKEVKTSGKIYQRGNATYYGNAWHGRKCASGERYDKDGYGCAHRTLPFGTLLKVTNTKNGKSVVVKVIDRGPFGKGMVVDLSTAAARDIDMLSAGIVPVTLEIVEQESALEAELANKQ